MSETIQQKKIQIIQKTGADTLAQMMPETTADQVISTAAGKVSAINVDAAINQLATGKVIDAENVNVTPKEGVLTSNTVQAALEEIAGAAATGGVTSINGKSGAVTLDAADVKAEPEGTVAAHNIAGDAHADIREVANAAKESAKTANDAIGVINGKLPTMETGITNAQSKADEAYNIAQGRAKAASFATFEAMTTALHDASATDYKVGDNLFIQQVGVPDYWIASVLDNNSGTYGYYTIAELETQKVTLTDYQKKTDDSLKTSDKTVVGAINEVKGTADTAKATTESQATNIESIQSNITEITGTTIPAMNQATAAAQSAAEAAQADATQANTAIDNITNGTTPVGKADNATTSDKFSAEKTVELTGPITGNVNTDFNGKVSIPTTITGNAVKTSNIADNQVTSAKLADIAALKGGASGMSAFDVNGKGQITKVGRVIEYDAGNGVPSADLAIGGLFFKIKQQ